MLNDKLAEYGKGVLILVDEVQANTPEMRSLAGTYQHLAGEGKDIAIAMAGLPGSVSHVLNDKVLTFLNRAQKVHLGPLGTGEVRAYYAKVFDKMKKKISNQALDLAAEMTRGFPYLLQLLGYYLVELTDGGDGIDVSVVRQAFASALCDLDEDVFKTTLQPLSERDVDFLHAMAQEPATDKMSEIQSRMGVSEKYVQVYRARLIEAGVIQPTHRGRVAFTLPYMGDYLRRKAELTSFDVYAFDDFGGIGGL